MQRFFTTLHIQRDNVDISFALLEHDKPTGWPKRSHYHESLLNRIKSVVKARFSSISTTK